jgi:DNA invertase Pin-like site-specific DNA recombinase
MTQNMVNAVSYMRVSTKRQGKTGLGLEAQGEIIKGYALKEGMVILKEYSEVDSGKKNVDPN